MVIVKKYSIMKKDKNRLKKYKKKNFKDESEIKSACIVCGAHLEYLKFADEVTCDICGKTFLSNIKCIHGHYVCDRCHNGDVLDHMEELLINSSEKNPVHLAEIVFTLPTMKRESLNFRQRIWWPPLLQEG